MDAYRIEAASRKLASGCRCRWPRSRSLLRLAGHAAPDARATICMAVVARGSAGDRDARQPRRPRRAATRPRCALDACRARIGPPIRTARRRPVPGVPPLALHTATSIAGLGWLLPAYGAGMLVSAPVALTCSGALAIGYIALFASATRSSSGSGRSGRARRDPRRRFHRPDAAVRARSSPPPSAGVANRGLPRRGRGPRLRRALIANRRPAGPLVPLRPSAGRASAAAPCGTRRAPRPSGAATFRHSRKSCANSSAVW